MLINDILTSQIRVGHGRLDMVELRFSDMHSYVERTFRQRCRVQGSRLRHRARSAFAALNL